MIAHINWMAVSGAIIAGLATGLGALPIYFKTNYNKENLDLGLGFSAGVMLVASFISLILPGIEAAEKIYPSVWAIFTVLLGLSIGYFFIIVIHDLLPHEHLNKANDMTHSHKKMSRVTLIVLAICLHNIPEGLAVGVGFGADDPSSGLTLATAIALQNMPEGLVVAFGFLSEGSTKNKAFLMALMSGLVEPVAAFFGYIGTTVSKYSLPVALGFAGGAMLFVICQEILPEIFKENGNEKKTTLGVISGVIVMLLVDHLV